MPNKPAESEADLTLELLSAVEDHKPHSQRSLANELGIALGLTNAYIKRCVKRGWIKATQAPPNRYGYYLTPRGFAEKSKLTARYLRSSLSFYRRARSELDEVFEACIAAGETKIALAGRGDLAEIALLCASQFPVKIVAVIDRANEDMFLGVPIVSSLDADASPDAIIVTDIKAPQDTYDGLAATTAALPIHAPKMLRIARQKPQGR